MAKKIFFISLVFFLFFPLLTFAYWTEPSQPAPNGNVPPPLNQGLQASPSFQYTWDNIGIGTSSFTQKLEVVGNVNIRDNVSDWSGLTIQPSYPRGSLTANYISTEIAGTGATHKPIIFRTNDANRLTIDTNGRVGIGTTSPLALLDVNNKLLVSNEQITINAPLNLNLPGDFSLSSDLQFTNPIASYIKSYAPLYIEAGDPNQNYDLILRSAGGGQVVVDDNLNVVGSLSAGSYIIQDITASSNVTAPIFYDKDNTLYFLDPHADIDGRSLILAGTVGIGTTGPGAKLTIQADDDKDAGPILNLGGKVANQVESGRIRFTETIAGVSPYYQGGYIHYNGSTNILNIGVHDASDSLTSSDINAISILRTNGNVGIGTTGPGSKLSVNGGISAGSYYATAAPSNGMIISGNVGIGTTGPGAPLDVKGPDTDNALLARFYSNTGQRGSFGIRNGVGTNPTTFIGTLGSSENLAIGANNIEVIRVQSSGNVGIGVTGPTARLHVIPTTNDEAFTVTGYSLTGSNAQSMLDLAGTWNTTGAPTAIRLNITDTASAESSGLLDLRVGGASRLFVRKDGKVGIGTTNPATSLDVTGGIKVISFTLPTGAGEGKVLTSDGDGTGFWKSLSEVSGVIGDGLTGQVTFWKTSSEIGGDNDLFWDITNKRLGIGTTSPTGKLEVSHNGTDRDLVVSSTNGRVGIYDPAPANRLSVDGDIAGSGILKISNEGKSYIQGQLAVGSTNPGGVTLDVNGNFKAKELEPFFETTRSSDSTVGQWTKVIDLDFNGQKYSEINTQVAILGRMQESLYPVFGFLNFALLTDGNGNLGAVRLDLSNWSLTNVVSKDDIVFVDTSGGGGTAAGSLYIRIKGDGGRYNAIGLSPLRVYRQGNTLNFLSDQGFISSLPAGTQYSASYADDYVNNLYAYGRIKTGNGSVASPAYSFIEDTDSGLYRLGANKIGLITAGLDTNGITIDSAGNVGIGTMGPISKFQIGRTDTEIQLWSGSTPYVFIQGVDNEVATPALQIKDENQIEMFTISTYADSGATGGRAYFGGNVGIGTNSPTTAKLVINPGTQPSIDAGSQRIINVATPTAPSDAVTKGYVDGASVSHALTADSADYATNAGAADNATYANSSLRATYLGSGFNITTDSQGNLEITGNVTITL